MASSGPASDRALIGRSLGGGRYVVSGLLGSGAQGATLEAVDKRDGRPVAIKRFVVRGARSWKDVELAEREAEVLSKLSHPLLPAAIEHFEHDGALYLVMEKLDGPTAGALGSVDRAEVWRFLRDAAEVLDYLHGLAPPVIHRDIKPGNVIRRPARPALGEERPRYALVDFGSVRNRLEPAGGSTVVGTFGYMAPEQFQGRAGPASDVYAVGVTALHMLTGVEPEHLPHRGLAIDVGAALAGGEATLSRLLERLVEPDPDKRPGRLAPLLAAIGESPGVAPEPGRQPPAIATPSSESPGPQQPVAEQAPTAAPAAADAGDGLWLPPPLAAAATLVLAVSELAVWLALGVALPLVLSLLSIVFGRSLRHAASQVVRAGAHARQSIARARESIRSSGPMHRSARRRMRHARRRLRRARRVGDVASTPKPEREQRSAGPRIESESRRPGGARIVDEAVGEVLAEMESALEDTLGEVDEEPRRRRR